jgi:hypothetical protein
MRFYRANSIHPVYAVEKFELLGGGCHPLPRGGDAGSRLKFLRCAGGSSWRLPNKNKV